MTKTIDNELLTMLTEAIGLSLTTVANLAEEFDELHLHNHALYCIWQMHRGRVKTPPGWYIASVKNDWSAPVDFDRTWQPKVLTFRVDPTTFAQIVREVKIEERR
ncbi:MAG: hypothetical protein FJ009_06150 [Chloroflexi bacterium]|nr:hypothetical protein [Chloroflexota bacterium]